MNIELKLIRILMALTDGDTNTAKRGVIEILEYLAVRDEGKRERAEHIQERLYSIYGGTVDFEAEK